VLCYVLVIEKYLAYMRKQRKNLMLNKGNNLMLTRLTPVATLAGALFQCLESPCVSHNLAPALKHAMTNHFYILVLSD